MADIHNSRLWEQIEGIPNMKDAFIVIVRTEWNAGIVDKLEAGCLLVLSHYGIRFKIITVPGAIEIPFAIHQCSLNSAAVSAFIALGCVVKGGTPHFDYVCQSVQT